MEDVWFHPVLNQDNASGKVSVTMKVSAPKGQKVNARLVLKDREGMQILEECIVLEENNGSLAGKISAEAENIKAWDNHSPYLYHAFVELRSENGK